MKNVISAIILSLCITIPAIAGQYQVTHVVDGDTIDVIYKGKKERNRMLNVDTPESVHPDQSRNTAMGYSHGPQSIGIHQIQAGRQNSRPGISGKEAG